MVGEVLSMYLEFELLEVSPQLKQWAYMVFGVQARDLAFSY